MAYHDQVVSIIVFHQLINSLWCDYHPVPSSRAKDSRAENTAIKGSKQCNTMVGLPVSVVVAY